MPLSVRRWSGRVQCEGRSLRPPHLGHLSDMPPRHIALVLAVCVAWGANFLALAWAVAELPPFFATALRLGIMMLLLPIIRPLPRGQRAVAALIAVVGTGIHF